MRYEFPLFAPVVALLLAAAGCGAAGGDPSDEASTGETDSTVTGESTTGTNPSATSAPQSTDPGGSTSEGEGDAESGGGGDSTGQPADCNDNTNTSGDTELAALAASLQPGEWGVLQDNAADMVAVLGDDGSSGHILTFSTNGKYNPATGEIFFHGGDHNGGYERFVRYSAADNLWNVQDDPPWVTPESFRQNHGYDYDALDADGQRYFYTNAAYDIQTCTWSDLPRDGLPGWARAQSAFEYFPGRGLVSLVYEEDDRSGVYILEDSASQWRQIGSIANAPPSGCTGCDPIAKYNHVHDILLVGGADGSDVLATVSGPAGSETLTPLGATPLDQIGVYWGVMVGDPLTGFYLYLDDAANLWQLDALADEWTQLDASLSPFADLFGEPKSDRVTAMPIPDHMVTLWLVYDAFGEGTQMLLYKHQC